MPPATGTECTVPDRSDRSPKLGDRANIAHGDSELELLTGGIVNFDHNIANNNDLMAPPNVLLPIRRCLYGDALPSVSQR